jgi:DNA-binding MarR family transcriptional regulator
LTVQTDANIEARPGAAPAAVSGTVPGAVPARGVDGESLSPLELGAWRGLLRVHAALIREMDAEMHARHGISLTAYEVLMLLGDAPGRRMRVSELSAATLLSVSGASRLLDRLVRDGLVTKQASEEDGRGAEAVLTPMGRGRLRAARASQLADVRGRFLSRFDDDELREMAGFWERLGADGAAA